MRECDVRLAKGVLKSTNSNSSKFLNSFLESMEPALPNPRRLSESVGEEEVAESVDTIFLSSCKIVETEVVSGLSDFPELKEESTLLLVNQKNIYILNWMPTLEHNRPKRVRYYLY